MMASLARERADTKTVYRGSIPGVASTFKIKSTMGFSIMARRAVVPEREPS
jgi:hypothetical protein